MLVAPPRARPLTGHDDAFGRIVTLGLPVQRGISGKSLADAHDLFSKRPELLLDQLVLNLAGIGED